MIMNYFNINYNYQNALTGYNNKKGKYDDYLFNSNNLFDNYYTD